VVTIDSPDNKSLTLMCGENAESLSVIDTDQQFASK
jgi:hypothetical protein